MNFQNPHWNIGIGGFAMKSYKIFAIITVVFFLALAPSAFAKQEAVTGADDQALEVEPYTVMTVSGEVSAIDTKGIAIVYDRNYDTGMEYEIYLPVDKSTTFKHKASLKEIKTGDFVSADYYKTKEGKSILKNIMFIQSGVNSALASEPEIVAPAAPSEPAGNAQE
jgi:Cu/Ag efflux protein CusF